MKRKPEDLTYVTEIGYPEPPKGPLQVLSSSKAPSKAEGKSS